MASLDRGETGEVVTAAAAAASRTGSGSASAHDTTVKADAAIEEETVPRSKARSASHHRGWAGGNRQSVVVDSYGSLPCRAVAAGAGPDSRQGLHTTSAATGTGVACRSGWRAEQTFGGAVLGSAVSGKVSMRMRRNLPDCLARSGPELHFGPAERPAGRPAE